MSRLSKLFAKPRGDAELRKSIKEALEDGTYGQPGHGWWGSGMVWNPGAPSGVTAPTQISAVFACQRLIADGIATLPAQTYTRVGPERIEYDLPQFLRFSDGLTRVQYLTQIVMSLLTDGNAFAAVVRHHGAIQELVPLDPSQITVKKVGRRILYEWQEEDFTPAEILHVPGLMEPGELRGMSPIRAAREVIEIAGQAQRHGKAWFQNAAVPPAVIKMPAAPGSAVNQGEADRARARLIADTWNETHGGTSNAGKVGVLIGGAELTSVALSNADSQWLESRQFSVQEIARIFGVPPHLIADSSNSTSWGSGLSEQNRTFGQFTLRPWIERIEDAHNRLLDLEGKGDVFWKINLDALLRADLGDRYDTYAKGITSGFLTPNEARRWEELPPVEGGDEVLRIPVGASPEQGPRSNDAQEGDDQ